MTRTALAGSAAFAALAAFSQAHAQSAYLSPDGKSRYPGITIFCPSGTGVTPCNFGGGGSGGTVTVNLSGAAVSGTNRFPVTDTALDGLLAGGSLPVSGSVAVSNFPGTVSVSNFPASQTVSGTVGVSGSIAVGSLPPLPAGTNAIGSVSVSNFPATQAVSGTVGVSALPALPAGANAIGSVAVSNFPATQAVTAASLPLPSGAANAANQTAPLAPVAPGTATATQSLLIGCLANATPPAFSNGQQGAVPCDNSGRPYVVTVPSQNNVPSYLQSVASGGSIIYRTINAASSAMAALIKSTSGMVYGYDVCNASAASVYFRLFAGGSVPTPGTSTPSLTKIVPAGGCQSVNLEPGVVLPGGIGVDVTSGSLADSDSSTISVANQVALSIYWK